MPAKSFSPSKTLHSGQFLDLDSSLLIQSTDRRLKKAFTYDMDLQSMNREPKKYRLTDEALKYSFIHKPFLDKTIK